MKHEWTFLAVAEGEGEMSNGRVLAICSTCGTVRAKGLPDPGSDEVIPLGGDCPDHPDVDRSVRGITRRA